MKLSLSGAHLDGVIRHAKCSFPKEACGILAGKEGKVFRLYRMTNTEEEEGRYSFSVSEQFDVQRRIRSDGLEMVGIYHSHTCTPAYPSSRDIKLAAHPGCSYLIVSIADGRPRVRSFRIEAGLVREEDIDVT